MEIKKANHIKGQIHIPGDKSISQRCVILGAIAAYHQATFYDGGKNHLPAWQ